MLAIAFYLGSDTLRRYSLGELETTFTTSWRYPRGRRLVLYDADGDFDREFEWWKETRRKGSPLPRRVVEPRLPITNGRSDLLVGSGSRLDIENVNLLATLLMHIEYGGYWGRLGLRFEQEMGDLLDRHLLAGLLDAPWVRCDDDPSSRDDNLFFAALQELVAYAFEEAVRVREGPFWKRTWRDVPARSSRGILQEFQTLLQRCHHDMTESRLSTTVPDMMIHASQPGSQPLDIPETIPNPAVIPAKPAPAPVEPARREPSKTPERMPSNEAGDASGATLTLSTAFHRGVRRRSPFGGNQQPLR